MRLVLVVSMLMAAIVARASDLPVSYAVQLKPLRASAVAGTPLTFTLFSDADCTHQVHQSIVSIENVALIARLKLMIPRGASSVPSPSILLTTLTNVTAPGNVYLTVTGAGVVASGAPCQAQAAQASGGLTTVAGVHLKVDGNGWVFRTPLVSPPFDSPFFLPADRQVGVTLNAFDPALVYRCDVEVAAAGSGLVREHTMGTPSVFGLQNCIALPATCNDTVKNGDESDVDCGGACGQCANLLLCNSDADCQSNTCTPWFYPAFSGPRCVPAACRDGLQDNNETGVDCGGYDAGSSCSGCPAGAACTAPNPPSTFSSDCANFQCIGGICQ